MSGNWSATGRLGRLTERIACLYHFCEVNASNFQTAISRQQFPADCGGTFWHAASYSRLPLGVSFSLRKLCVRGASVVKFRQKITAETKRSPRTRRGSFFRIAPAF